MAEIREGNITVSMEYAYAGWKGIPKEEFPNLYDNLRYKLEGGNFREMDYVLEDLGGSVIDYAIGFLERTSLNFRDQKNYNGEYGSVQQEINSLKDRESFKVKPPEGGSGRKSIIVENIRSYAGHIEYGFLHTRSGEFLGPYPYMRPALKLAAAESTGMLEEFLKEEVLYYRDSYHKTKYRMRRQNSDFYEGVSRIKVGKQTGLTQDRWSRFRIGKSEGIHTFSNEDYNSSISLDFSQDSRDAYNSRFNNY